MDEARYKLLVSVNMPKKGEVINIGIDGSGITSCKTVLKTVRSEWHNAIHNFPKQFPQKKMLDARRH